MSIVKNNNCAGRLYYLLDSARNCDGSKITKDVWWHVLDVSPDSETEFFEKLALFQHLVDEVPERIKSVDGINHELLLMKYNNIRQATSFYNLSIQWNNYRRYLDEATMLNLSYCAEELSKHESEKTIEQETLSELLQDIAILLDKLHNSSINSQLKQLLIHQLNLIRRGIQEYKISGPKVLYEYLARFYGEFLFKHNLFEHEKDDKTIKETLSFIWKATNIILTIYNAGQLAYDGFNWLKKICA